VITRGDDKAVTSTLDDGKEEKITRISSKHVTLLK
jgi:hypothetical protein